jgi:hypothetical protein
LQEKRKQPKSMTTVENDSQLCEDDEGIDSILVDDVMTGDDQEQSKFQEEGGALVDVAKDILGTNISEKWLHMDQVEAEKLEWMKKSPSVKKSGVGLRFVIPTTLPRFRSCMQIRSLPCGFMEIRTVRSA